MDASAASQRVGYLSASQFSREYSRFFGSAPAKDMARVRNDAGACAQVDLTNRRQIVGKVDVGRLDTYAQENCFPYRSRYRRICIEDGCEIVTAASTGIVKG